MTERYYAHVEAGVFPVYLEADPDGDYQDDGCVNLSPELVQRYFEAGRAFRDINIELLNAMGNEYMAREWKGREFVYGA